MKECLFQSISLFYFSFIVLYISFPIEKEKKTQYNVHQKINQNIPKDTTIKETLRYNGEFKITMINTQRFHVKGSNMR